MTQLEYNKDTFQYLESIKMFSVSELEVPKFDTSYRLWNPETKHGKIFNFSHSTGPEFAADTKFVYKTDCGLTLSIANDPVLTKRREMIYLNAKSNFLQNK